jgi:hypothetical protein
MQRSHGECQVTGIEKLQSLELSVSTGAISNSPDPLEIDAFNLHYVFVSFKVDAKWRFEVELTASSPLISARCA